ncbi:pseudouridine synthase [Xylaria palmicola]|nr:pseudouridine synthase [Xylaria palmicola]
MWSLSSSSSACRSRSGWRPDRWHQLLACASSTAAGRRVVRCSGFSTAPIAQAHVNATKRPKMDESAAGSAATYGRWTKDALIKRILDLERTSRAAAPEQGTPAIDAEPGSSEAAAGTAAEAQGKKQKKKAVRSIDPSKYSTRLIALKLAYLGKNYGGFEYQPSAKLPTIEEELWKALVKACLIFPENPDEVDFPGDYSKCGRTDRGVSAFGQVIGIRVRSNRPLPKEPEASPASVNDETTTEAPTRNAGGETEAKVETLEAAQKAPERLFNDFIDELCYPHILNRLLPPDIRILAWCPTVPDSFSARHDCRERRYRYFFTQPAYPPTPGSLEDPARRDGKANKPKDGWLDLEAMRAAAKKFEGVHDFRNFCRIDPGKDQQSFERRIFESDIVEVPGAETALPYLRDAALQPASFSAFPGPSEPGTTASAPPSPPAEGEVFPKVYYFHVRGSAFLWHQIRCMVSVLFLVGQGLEDPSVVDRLLDVAAEPRRPAYNMADETPLVLWDCRFPRDLDDPERPDDLGWVHVGEEDPLRAHGHSGLVGGVWARWREHKMDELLAGQLLGVVASQADLSLRRNPRAPRYVPAAGQRAFEGGNRERGVGKYVPLLKKERVASPEEAYDREAKRRGWRDAAHRREVEAKEKAALLEKEKADAL